MSNAVVTAADVTAATAAMILLDISETSLVM
jgi:hypothetical protein